MNAMTVIGTLSSTAKLVLMDWDAWLEYGDVTGLLAELTDAQLTAAINEIQDAGLMLDCATEV